MEPWRTGFKELEYRSGDWYYRDSYAGFFRSWGQEIVWYQDKPFWSSLYGGGMVDTYLGDSQFADTTFAFLKKAMSAGDKAITFQPRGPATFAEGEWSYASKLVGDITKFQGDESISCKGELVFTHHFFGGLIIQ